MKTEAPQSTPLGPAHDEQREMGDHILATAKQSGQVLFIKMLMFGASFVSSFVLARFFGAAVIGEFALMISVIGIAIVLSVFGLDSAMFKYVPIARAGEVAGEPNLIAYIALTTSLVFASLCALVLILLSDVLANAVFEVPELRNLLRIGGIGLIPFTLSKVMGGIYRGSLAASAYSLVFDFIAKFLLLSFVVTVALFGLRTSFYVAIAWLASQTITLTILIVRARRFNLDLVSGRKLALQHPERKRKNRRKLLGFASTMILAALMSFVLGRIDILMIGLFRDASEVGVYKVALVIAGLTTFVMGSTNSIFPAFISELFAGGKLEQLQGIYRAVTKWIVILTAPLVLSMLLFPQSILSFFGPEYVAGSSVLQIIAIGYFVSAMVGANGFMLSMTGHERIVLANNLVMAVLNIGMNLVLIPRLGIVGAAIATAVSIGSINLVKVVEVKVLMGIMPYDRTYLPVLLGIAATVALAVLVRPWVGNAYAVSAVTLVNLILAVAIAYRFRTEIDNLVFRRIASRFRRSSVESDSGN